MWNSWLNFLNLNSHLLSKCIILFSIFSFNIRSPLSNKKGTLKKRTLWTYKKANDLPITNEKVLIFNCLISFISSRPLQYI